MSPIDEVLINALYLAFCAGLSMAICGFVAAAALSREGFVRLLPLLFGVSILGAAAGFSGGLSREGVVGDIIPAALTLIASVAAWLFGTKPESREAPAVAFAAAGFALGLSFAYTAGANLRSQSEAKAAPLVLCHRLFTDAETLSDPHAYRRAYETFGKFCAETMANSDVSLFDKADQTDAARAYYYDDWLDGLERANIDARAQIAGR